MTVRLKTGSCVKSSCWSPAWDRKSRSESERSEILAGSPGLSIFFFFFLMNGTAEQAYCVLS